MESVLKAAALSMGYTSLKREQEKAVLSILNGRDVFVMLPTGFGKSLCYGLFPRMFDFVRSAPLTSIVMVVSPLVALMKDQVDSFTGKGLRAAYVSEDMDKELQQSIENGKYQLVFLSPEALFGSLRWRRMLCTDIYKNNLVAFVVDEAHCVQKWGGSFRRDFSNLGEIRSLVADSVKIMALTATATKTTRQAIVKTLSMVDPVYVTVPPSKDNISYYVCIKSDIETAFAPVIDRLITERTNMDRIIIYCKRYQEITTLYHLFKSRLGDGFTEPAGAPGLAKFRLVDMFTHCTHTSVKTCILEQFRSQSPLRIVIATIAFGMGVDCPDVRQTIHWGVSDDLEMYVQESGRVGCDGKASVALTVYKQSDFKYTTEAMQTYCSTKDVCRRSILFEDFTDCSFNVTVPCLCCDVCAKNCACGDCAGKMSNFFISLP